jgi:hypothetical protein
VLGVRNWRNCVGQMTVENVGRKDIRCGASAATNNAPSISKLQGMEKKSERERERELGWKRKSKSRTFSKPNCFSSAMEWDEWSVSWATAEGDCVCWGVANDIHLAAFPIAMLCGDGGVSEAT